MRKMRAQSEDHNNEVDEINKGHLSQMMKEREKHCHLYSLQTNFKNLQEKQEQNTEVIADQRNEINILLKKVQKYAPKEFNDYPATAMVNKPFDYSIWKLTREAESDEQLISQLKKQRTADLQQQQILIKKNQSLRDYVSTLKE